MEARLGLRLRGAIRFDELPVGPDLLAPGPELAGDLPGGGRPRLAIEREDQALRGGLGRPQGGEQCGAVIGAARWHGGRAGLHGRLERGDLEAHPLGDPPHRRRVQAGPGQVVGDGLVGLADIPQGPRRRSGFMSLCLVTRSRFSAAPRRTTA